MIKIDKNSINTFKIKKIKDYEIIFELNDEKFLIHNKSEMENWCLDLYRIDKIGIFGHYKLTFLDSSIKYIGDYFIGNHLGIKNLIKINNKNKIINLNNIVYKNINIDYFLYFLTFTFDILESIYYQKVKFLKEKFIQLKNKEKEINEEFKLRLKEISYEEYKIFN